HVQLLFIWNPSPLRPSKLSFEYLLQPRRSAPAAAPPGPAPSASAPPRRPSYSSRRKSPGHERPLSCRRRPGMGLTLQRHPFSGLVDSAGEVLHTPYPSPASLARVLSVSSTNTFSGV